MAHGSKFKIQIIGKFNADVPGNEDHVFVSILAGDDWEHLSLCGTLTMTDPQWATFADALHEAIGDSVRVEDLRVAS